MSPTLFERSAPLDALREAIGRLGAGRSGVILISGEAGIGKTSLVEAALGAVGPELRVLRGACDDLVAANPLGPLREATRDLPGPTGNALAEGRLDAVLETLAAELAQPVGTVLAVEDLHWADDATLDVLGYLARRIDHLRLLLLATYRDDEVHADHPAQRFLAAVPPARTVRLELAPLSPASVEQLSAGSGWDGRLLHELTGGNPFYVTETLAAPPDAPVPRSVSDAVLARLRQLSPPARACVERMSVWPGLLDFGLAEVLLGDEFEALAEAEALGVITVRLDGLAFRHELARRATEASLAGLRRRSLQRQVTEILRRRADTDLSRLVHHAILCQDAATIAEYAPRAGRESSLAGAHRQALAFYAAALTSEDRLAPPVLAEVLDGYAWELYNAHRFAEAVGYGRRAVDLLSRLGDAGAEAAAMGRLSRHLFMLGQPDEARALAGHAVGLAAGGGPQAVAAAEMSLGALQALDVESDAAADTLRRGSALAASTGRRDLVALAWNYETIARDDLDPAGRIDLLRRSLALAGEFGAYEFVARGYTNLAELLYRYGRYEELRAELDQGLRFTRERGFWSHAFNLEVHEALLAVRAGDWEAAETGLRDLVGRYEDPGMLILYSHPPYARLLARRGDRHAESLLRASWARAGRQRMLIGLGYAGAALMEWCWLTGEVAPAREILRVWQPVAGRPAAGPLWAEICRYASRLGLGPFEVPDDAGEPWTLGLTGDWRAAAAAWAAIGDPYEQALELAGSDESGPMLEALGLLDRLGAVAAAAWVRDRLRGLGVRTLPRGPRATTRQNPGGLTARQLDIAALLADGLTNPEIAAQLVLSVRTVDHHVSSILTKLGVESRREAAQIARSWAPG